MKKAFLVLMLTLGFSTSFAMVKESGQIKAGTYKVFLEDMETVITIVRLFEDNKIQLIDRNSDPVIVIEGTVGVKGTPGGREYTLPLKIQQQSAAQPDGQIEVLEGADAPYSSVEIRFRTGLYYDHVEVTYVAKDKTRSTDKGLTQTRQN